MKLITHISAKLWPGYYQTTVLERRVEKLISSSNISDVETDITCFSTSLLIQENSGIFANVLINNCCKCTVAKLVCFLCERTWLNNKLNFKWMILIDQNCDLRCFGKFNKLIGNTKTNLQTRKVPQKCKAYAVETKIIIVLR